MTTPEPRTELIFRVNLPREHATRVIETLTPLARRLGGSLSAIDRDRYPDHERHVRRLEISSQRELVEEIYPPSDFDYDPSTMGDYAADVYFAPCVGES